VAKAKPSYSAQKRSEKPITAQPIILTKTSEITKVRTRKGGGIALTLRSEWKPLSREAREHFRQLDLNPPEKYRLIGVRPVPYLYRDPRTKKEGRISIGRMLQHRALAILVLDDQTKMALGRGNLFGKAVRTHLNRVRSLAQILDLEERFEQEVAQALKRNTSREMRERSKV